MILPVFQSGFYLNYTQNSIFATQRTQTTPTIIVKEIVGICFKERTKQYKTYICNIWRSIFL